MYSGDKRPIVVAELLRKDFSFEGLHRTRSRVSAITRLLFPCWLSVGLGGSLRFSTRWLEAMVAYRESSSNLTIRAIFGMRAKNWSIASVSWPAEFSNVKSPGVFWVIKRTRGATAILVSTKPFQLGALWVPWLKQSGTITWHASRKSSHFDDFFQLYLNRIYHLSPFFILDLQIKLLLNRSVRFTSVIDLRRNNPG